MEPNNEDTTNWASSALVCLTAWHPISLGQQWQGAPGPAITHPDVQVLEEGEERLPDQLELPSREAPIYLQRQSSKKQFTFRSEVRSADRQG